MKWINGCPRNMRVFARRIKAGEILALCMGYWWDTWDTWILVGHLGMYRLYGHLRNLLGEYICISAYIYYWLTKYGIAHMRNVC